jgi:hypothetical protein
LAYDFNDDTPAVDGPDRVDPPAMSEGTVSGDVPASEGAATVASGHSDEIAPASAQTVPVQAVPVQAAPAHTAPAQAAPSPAFVRFRSCRWQQPIEKNGSEFCTHREVKPYAGTVAFDADAWCGDCQHYKLRRIPKKRPRDEDWAY